MKNVKEYEIIERPTVLNFGLWSCTRKCKFELVSVFYLMDIIIKGGYTEFESSDEWQDYYDADSPIKQRVYFNEVIRHDFPLTYTFFIRDDVKIKHCIAISNIKKILVREDKRKDEMIIVFRCENWFDSKKTLSHTIVARKEHTNENK